MNILMLTSKRLHYMGTIVKLFGAKEGTFTLSVILIYDKLNFRKKYNFLWISLFL